MRFDSTNQKWVYIALKSSAWILIFITLSQLELFKVLVFGKVCFNLIKTSLFCLFLFSFFYCFLFLFGFSFLLFLPVSGQFPLKKIAPSGWVRVWVNFRVRDRLFQRSFVNRSPHFVNILPLGLWGTFPREQLYQNRFSGGKKEDFLHANEILSFIHLVYVQSCTFFRY